MSEALFKLFVESVLDTSKFDKGMEGSATKVESSLSRMASAAKQYLGAGGLLWSFNRANAQAMQFGQTMADVAAITELNVDKMAKSLLKLDHIFGRPAQTGYTLYETISSGIKGTEDDLLHFVEVAGKTAKVIRADTYTTSNALTTMMHAYGISARESTKLMDIMYTTVKEGKAHGNELARTLGLVVNNASESGIAIKDLFAAIATLSRTMTASNAMISLNQMMNSFLGPTEEARRVAREYGIEMDVAAIKSKGFAAVMKDIHDKVGGNVTAIKSLFGNIRAARGALVLTGSQFDNFVDVLHEFDRTAGEAEEAFKTQTETTQAEAERMRNAFNKLQITVGKDMEGLVKTFYKLGTAAMDGFGNAEGALGGFVNSVGGNFKSDSPWIQFLNSADKLTASWSRFFLYFTIGAKVFSGFAKATASVESAMKGMAHAGQINAAGAASAKGLGSAIPGAASEKMPSPAKIKGVAVTEPVNQINLQLKELGVSLKQLASNINKIKDKATALNTTAIDIHHYIQSVRGEFNLLLTNWKKIQKEMIVLSKKGETASVTIQGCSASVQAFSITANRLSKLLMTISTKAETLKASLVPADASIAKTSSVMGRVASGFASLAEKVGAILLLVKAADKAAAGAVSASAKLSTSLPAILTKLVTSATTMSGSLSTIAHSIEQTNRQFLRAITYAGGVNAAVQTLETRLLTLSKALAGKGAPALLRTSPASKAPTGKSSATTTSSSDAPKVPAVQQHAKSFVATSREKAWLALLYKGETDIASDRIKPYPKKNIKVRNVGYAGDWMFSSPTPRPRYIDRALTDGPTGLGPGTMFMRRPAEIANEYARPSADRIRAAMRMRRNMLADRGMSERAAFETLNRGLMLPQNAGQNGNPVLQSVSKADFAKLQKLQQQGAQYYGNQLGGAQRFPLVPTKFPPPYNDQFSNTPGSLSSRISGADYRNINQMAAKTMGRGGRLMLPAPDPQVYAGIAPETANFARKLREQSLKNTIGGTTGSGNSDIIKVISAKADKAVDVAKKSFIGIGKAFSGVARVGMGVFGAISAIQIGWSIGTQIAEKFKFSESELYQAIADMVVGKAPGSTKKEQEEIGKYNVTMMAASTRKRVEGMREKGTIDASQYRSFLKDLTKAYSVKSEQGKQILDTLNSTLVEIADKARTSTDTYSDAVKALDLAVKNAADAYNEQAQRVRDIENKKEYSTTEMADIAAKMYNIKAKSKPGRELWENIDPRDMNLPLTPFRDLWGILWSEGGEKGYDDRKAEGAFTERIKEILERLASDPKVYSAEEIVNEFTDKNMDFLFAPLELVKQVIAARSTGAVDRDGLAAEKDSLEERASALRMAQANKVTGMVIEAAKKIETDYRESELQTRLNEINKKIVEGIDESQIEQMRADLKSAESQMMQSIFYGIQQQIKKAMDTDEFKALKGVELEKAMKALNVQVSAFYGRMLTDMDAAKQAADKAMQAYFDSVQARFERNMGTILFVPSDQILPSMQEKKITELGAMAESLKKRKKGLQDEKDELDRHTADSYYDIRSAEILKHGQEAVIKRNAMPVGSPEREELNTQIRALEAEMGFLSENRKKILASAKNTVTQQIDALDSKIFQAEANTSEAERELRSMGLDYLKDMKSQLDYRKDIGAIGEGQHSEAVIKNYEAQLSQLKEMLPFMGGEGTAAYRATILEMYGLTKAIKDQKEAYNENKRALREGAFGTISDMTQGNNRNALYHAVNILGMMSGPNRLARLTAPSLDLQDPFTLGKAQKAQQSLAATMDSYLMSQKYEQANVGKTVTKIYDFISKNNAIILR